MPRLGNDDTPCSPKEKRSIRIPRRVERDVKDEARVNDRIRAREIRVVDVDGSQLGVMTPPEAIERAADQGLDLVEVAPNAQPPVCRIMDYGKYKYEQKKKKGAGKAKAHAATMKEVKVRPRTDDHDLEFKLRNARKFLTEGDKVKVTLMFRGREIVHKELGRDQLDRVKEMLGDIATVENPPRLDGRFMSMILVPNRDAIKAKQSEAGAEEDKEAPSPSGGGRRRRRVAMPKMRTHRGAAKRFKRTGTGKISRMRKNKSHILTKKDRKRKRRLRQPALVSSHDRPRMEQMLPS